MENKQNLKNRFHDIIECPICYNVIREHLMCPKCKKLFCKNCLKMAYDNNALFCPLCKEKLMFNEYIPIPFMSRISNYIDNDIKHLKRNRNKSTSSKYINISNNQKDNNKLNVNNINLIKINNRNNNNKNNLYDEHSDFISIKNGLNLINNIEIGFKNEENLNKCQKHNRLYSYFCIDCLIFLCDECTSIQNPEAKIHVGHKSIKYDKVKIFNLEEVIKKYNDLIKKKEKILNKIFEKKEKIKINKFENDLINNCFSTLENLINREYESKSENLEENKTQIVKFKKEIIDNIPKIKNAIINIINRNEKLGYQNLLKYLNDFDSLLNRKNAEISLLENNKENEENSNILNLSNNTDIFSFKIKNLKEKIFKDQRIKNDNFYEKTIKNVNYDVNISFNKINLKQQINMSIVLTNMKKNTKNFNLYFYFYNNNKNYTRIEKLNKIIENEKEISFARLITENELFKFLNEKGEILVKFSIFYTIKNINIILND